MSNEKEEIQPSFPKQLQQDSNQALQPPETTAPNGDGNNDRKGTKQMSWNKFKSYLMPILYNTYIDRTFDQSCLPVPLGHISGRDETT